MYEWGTCGAGADMSRSSHLLVQGPRQELEPGKTRSKSRSRAEEDGQEKGRSILF